MKRFETLSQIQDAGIIAVVGAETADKAIKVVEALVAGGIKGIELTFTVPQADQVISQLAAKYAQTDVVIGTGTVLEPVTARLAINDGAQFLVSPLFDEGTAKMANLYQVPYLAGAFTITEIKTALEAGVDIVKMFLGAEASPSMVKAVMAPMPQLSIMPSGGVSLDNMEEWINAGVFALGAGGNLLKPADTDDYAGVTAMAKKFMTKYRQLKQK